MSTIRKALTAAGFGLVGALGTSLLDGNLTGGEVLFSLGTGLVAGYATYQISNAPA